MIPAILIAVLIIAVWVFVFRLEKIKNNKFVKSLITAVGVILLCEIFIFNAGVFRTAFTKTPEKVLSFQTAELTNLEQTGSGVRADGAGEYSIKFSSIDCPVDTIHFDVSEATGFYLKEIPVLFSDETFKALRENACGISYIPNNEKSEYIACSFSGDVSKLEFSFTLEEGQTLAIDGITLNAKIPFSISPIRLLFLMLLVLPVVAVMKSKRRDEKVDLEFLKRVCMVVAAVFVVITFTICSVQSPSIINDFKNPTHNQVNYELVNSFKSGTTVIDVEPTEELLALENPYDISQRGKISILWDHLLYEGKYYSYYGIGPVFLLFLPYNLITGTYFPSLWACFIFGSVGLVFLAMTYFSLIKRFFPKISNGIAIFGLLITMIMSEVWYDVAVDNFYEIALSSSFAAVAAGAYFLLESNAVSEGKISLKKACISSIFLAFAVLCRPTTAMYCIAALVFIFFGAKKLWTDKKELTKYLCAALIPFAVFGSVQMIYNAVRFGSPFEFGIKYSLTINDFTKSEFHWPFVFVTLYNFLFAFPNIQPSAPYVFENYSSMGVNGFFFNTLVFPVGLFFKALPTFGYTLAGKAWRESGKNKKGAILTLSACVLAPLIIIFSIWESGYTTRYAVDFSWQILFGAFVILFTLYQVSKSVEIKHLMTKFFAVSFVVAAITNTAIVSRYMFYINRYLSRQIDILSFSRLFDFFDIF